MHQMTIGQPVRGRPVANEDAKRLFRDQQFPLNVVVANRLTVVLSLPEAGIKLDPMARAITKFSDFDRLQRTVSSLEQIARLNDVPEVATLALEVASDEQEPESEPQGGADGTTGTEGGEGDATGAEEGGAGDTAPAKASVNIVQDDDEAFIVELDGVQFEPQRNQVRDDNSLTNGGIAAFKEAKAAAEKAK